MKTLLEVLNNNKNPEKCVTGKIGGGSVSIFLCVGGAGQILFFLCVYEGIFQVGFNFLNQITCSSGF